MFIPTDEHRNRLTRRAFTSLPLEACGFILADGRIIECNNISQIPFKQFVMSSSDLCARMTLDEMRTIVAIWHTHPRGSRYPSKLDLDAISYGVIKPDWAYLIATVDELYCYDSKDFAPQQESFWGSFLQV